MKLYDILKRYTLLIISLAVMGAAVALSIKSNTGVSPISCPPYVFSEFFAPSVGQATIIMHVLFVIIQIILLGRKFEKRQLLQIFVGIVFGLFIDLFMYIFDFCNPQNYLQQFILLILSIIIMAVGIFAEVSSKAVYLAGEGLMLAVAQVTEKDFSKVKIVCDCSLVALSAVCSFFFFDGKIIGIREGTLISALVTGYLIGFCKKYLKFIPNFVNRAG